MAPSRYREYPAPARLARDVLCLWSQEIGAAPHRQRVLPDGCVDLVWIGEAPAVVAGPATGPVMVPLAPRATLVGVRLRPGTASRVLGPPASALRDRETPLGDIWGTDGAPWMRVGEAASTEAKLACAAAAVTERLAAAEPPDRGIGLAVRWLARHPANRIEDLAHLLETTPRTLHRRFTLAVGYGPKTFQRILRLQRLLALAGRARGRAPLAGLALAAGYADQAHMSREVRALAGQSARHLLCDGSSTTALSDLFKTDTVPAL